MRLMMRAYPAVRGGDVSRGAVDTIVYGGGDALGHDNDEISWIDQRLLVNTIVSLDPVKRIIL